MSHAISCPHCSAVIAIKETRPGRFRVKCPRCEAGFLLAVPDDPALPPVASIETEAPVLSLQTPPEPAPVPAPAAAPPPVPMPEEPVGPAPRRLGGYRIFEALSRGGPIPAFRARRRSDPGDVALSIMPPRRAADLAFVARWMREAYAASRLAHPNLGTIRDLGVDQGRPFAAGEPVAPAPSPDGKRPDRAAIVARFLHAARGLKHAHDQAIFHRHLGPASLVDDDRGVVRVVGLGTGMTPETPPMPAFGPIAVPGVAPAPPDPNDPAVIAAREDIVALGRALRAALGADDGRGLPPGLAAVTRKMVDGGPEGHFADMGAVVAALEYELGVPGPFAPREEEAAAWEDAARAFVEPPLARLRPKLTLGAWGVCGLFAALFVLAGKPMAALTVVGFAGLVVAALVATRGAVGVDPLARRVRELILGGDRGDLATLAAGVTLAIAALHATSLLWFWLFLGGLAAALAVAYHFALDRPIAEARASALDRASELLRGLRGAGVEEDSIRRFACRQAGKDWEELYEALFGYDALRSSRLRWGLDVGGARRPRHSAWRDPIADAIDRKLADRRRARDRALLQSVEEHGREARGINLLTARRQGHRASEAMVHIGDEYARSLGEGLGRPLMRALIDASERPDAFLASTWSDDARAEPPAWRVALGTALGLVAGPRARFLLGGLLLAGSLVWMDQNQIISGEAIKREAVAVVEDREKALAEFEALKDRVVEGVQGAADAATSRPSEPLKLDFLPPALARRLDGIGLGVAGLILLVASAFRGTRISAFVVPAALVAVLGPGLADPSARPGAFASLACQALAAGLLALGVFFGRERD